MSSKRFIVISSGHVLDDFTVEQVAENLGKLYNDTYQRRTSQSKIS